MIEREIGISDEDLDNLIADRDTDRPADPSDVQQDFEDLVDAAQGE